MRTLGIPLLLSLSLFACAVDETDDSVAQLDQEVSGAAYNNGQAGLLIVSNGDGRVYTGFLVADDVAVTGSAVTAGHTARQMSVENGVWLNNPTGTTRTVTRILKHPDLDIAYLKLSAPYAGNRNPLDAHAPSALPLGTYNCFGYDQSRALKRISMTLNGANDTTQTYTMSPAVMGHDIADNDDGVPCSDGSNWIGAARSTSGTTHTQIAASAIAAWTPVAQQLFPIAAQSSRFALYNGNNKCLDIAWGSMGIHAAINQYTCHYNSNQLWYFDFRSDSSHPMIVSARSGKCIDSPWALPNQPLQTYDCNNGSNQRFAWYLHDPQGSGFAYVSSMGPLTWPISTQHLCLSVVGGPTNTDSVATEVRACQSSLTNTDQRWFITYR